MRIGNLNLKNRLFLAPMVDVTDLPYRLLCRKCGAGMAYTEMLYIDAILHENRKTLDLMKTCHEDNPLGLQITGNSVEEFERFVSCGVWKKFDLIDLNCGCPSLRIVGNSAGSFLLRNPAKIGEIICVLKKTGKPVSVKVRLGFKKNNVLSVARTVEKAGADALTVHARLAVDGRDVPADWSWISKVKKAVKIPVIGNGDVFSGEDAMQMLKICDGVMIARGAIGEPLIFSRVLEYLENGNESERDFLANWKLFREYLKLVRKYEIVDLGRIKYIGGKFIKGFAGAGKLRAEFMGIRNFEGVEKFVWRKH